MYLHAMISLKQEVLPIIYHHHDILILIKLLYAYINYTYIIIMIISKQIITQYAEHGLWHYLHVPRDRVPRSGVPIVKSRLV